MLKLAPSTAGRVVHDPREISAQLRTAISELVEHRGMSRTAFAVEMGIDQPYVSNVLNGRKTLTLPFLYRALAILGADVEVLPLSDEDFEFTPKPDWAPAQL